MNELTKRERDRELLGIAEILSTIDTSQFESEESLQLYERLTQEIFPIVSDQLYDEGHDLYSAGKYEEALETLNMSYNYNSDNVDAIYFIARSYHRLEDYENARVYYEIVINDFSDSRRFNDAKQFLNSISED